MKRIIPDTAWALVPARGGSKSIPYKNLVKICGKTLLELACIKARESGVFQRIICSTDDQKIGLASQRAGAEWHKRPLSLSGDEAPILDVILHFLKNEKILPEVLVLLQVTSPFLTSETLARAVKTFVESKKFQSLQTITLVAHNDHAYNQRIFENEKVSFKFARQRKLAYNKQLKPKFYKFGNLVMTRTASLISGKGIFANPSKGMPVGMYESVDIDGPNDVDYANWLIDSGRIKM